MTFRALLTDSTADGLTNDVVELDDAVLPNGDVIIDVAWSSLNYKDGLVLTGGGRLVRDYPHVGGVDLAGTVVTSGHPDWAPGDRVVVTGWRVGELWWGGYATRASVKAAWLSRVPEPLSFRQAMAVGTAGFTAMLALDTLERHGLSPTSGPLLVTGASGGVGSSAVHMASRLGYHVVASSGRASERRRDLVDLGASEVIDRADLESAPNRPLLSERWAGAIDAVGGATLAHVLAETRYGGAVAACGLAGGDALPSNVMPFLLRGITLFGIDSVLCPTDRRLAIWRRVADTVDLAMLDAMTSEVGLADLAAAAPAILAGRIAGRTVVDPHR